MKVVFLKTDGMLFLIFFKSKNSIMIHSNLFFRDFNWVFRSLLQTDVQNYSMSMIAVGILFVIVH